MKKIVLRADVQLTVEKMPDNTYVAAASGSMPPLPGGRTANAPFEFTSTEFEKVDDAVGDVLYRFRRALKDRLPEKP
jgi:hypothetical protein